MSLIQGFDIGPQKGINNRYFSLIQNYAIIKSFAKSNGLNYSTIVNDWSEIIKGERKFYETFNTDFTAFRGSTEELSRLIPVIRRLEGYMEDDFLDVNDVNNTSIYDIFKILQTLMMHDVLFVKDCSFPENCNKEKMRDLAIILYKYNIDPDSFINSYRLLYPLRNSCMRIDDEGTILASIVLSLFDMSTLGTKKLIYIIDSCRSIMKNKEIELNNRFIYFFDSIKLFHDKLENNPKNNRENMSIVGFISLITKDYDGSLGSLEDFYLKLMRKFKKN